MNIQVPPLRAWIGRAETARETVREFPAHALAAMLDREPSGDDVQEPGWHWLYFLPHASQSEIGADGHPCRGGLLPPVPLPRRMWAGSRIDFVRAPRVGQVVSRTSTIDDVSEKDGRSGRLIFVRLLHRLHDERGELLTEAQDIVYRDYPRADEPLPASRPGYGPPEWHRQIAPNPVLLFRFSALTFNGHRIHYDRDYAVGVEGYPGLVVQGPLIATLLLDLVRRSLPEARLRSFSFRAVSPLFGGSPFRVCGRPEKEESVLRLWAEDEGGRLAMDATAELRRNQ